MSRHQGISQELSYEFESIHDQGLSVNTRTIFVTPSGPEGEVDGPMAAQFLKNLHILETTECSSINVVLSTGGGSWDYGMAMYDAINRSPCHITTFSYATASSMSSIIPQAADWRVIMPTCSFMAHYGTDGAEGHTRAVVSNAGQSEREIARMVDVYAERCQYGAKFDGKDLSAVKRFLRQQLDKRVNWWLSPHEAVEYGFMDRVSEDHL